MIKVFISYASEDYSLAKRLYDDLHRPGIDPWLDDELRPGGEWNDDIIGQIAECSHFVALISPHSLRDARFVRREWDQALDHNKPFVPVRLEESALPDFLKSKQWEDLFPYETGLVRLLRFFHQEKRTGVFEETFSCNGADNADWSCDGWALDALDHTGRQSQSLHGAASLSSTTLLPQAVTRRASVTYDASGAEILSYFRRLKLSALMSEARFAVIINDGADHVVDEEAGAADQDGWEARRVKLPALSGQVMLTFAVSARSQMNYLPRAEAWIDDIMIS
jgi:hypothetical protein